MSYPLHMFKNRDGNWVFVAAADAEQEKARRAEGFKLPEELWPTDKPKRKEKDKP